MPVRVYQGYPDIKIRSCACLGFLRRNCVCARVLEVSQPVFMQFGRHACSLWQYAQLTMCHPVCRCCRPPSTAEPLHALQQQQNTAPNLKQVCNGGLTSALVQLQRQPILLISADCNQETPCAGDLSSCWNTHACFHSKAQTAYKSLTCAELLPVLSLAAHIPLQQRRRIP